MNTRDFMHFMVTPNRPDGLEIRTASSSESSAEDSLKSYACGQPAWIRLSIEKGLKDIVGKQSAAGREANEISSLLKKFVGNKTGDCRTQILQGGLAEVRGNFAQVDTAVQAESEEKSFFEGGGMRYHDFMQG